MAGAGRWIFVSFRRGVRPDRQNNREGCTFVDFGGNADFTLMFLDDIVGNTQAEAGAFADLLRGKEGFKQPGDVIRRDAAAGVGNCHHDTFAL